LENLEERGKGENYSFWGKETQNFPKEFKGFPKQQIFKPPGFCEGIKKEGGKERLEKTFFGLGEEEKNKGIYFT